MMESAWALAGVLAFVILVGGGVYAVLRAYGAHEAAPDHPMHPEHDPHTAQRLEELRELRDGD